MIQNQIMQFKNKILAPIRVINPQQTQKHKLKIRFKNIEQQQYKLKKQKWNIQQQNHQLQEMRSQFRKRITDFQKQKTDLEKQKSNLMQEMLKDISIINQEKIKLQQQKHIAKVEQIYLKQRLNQLQKYLQEQNHRYQVHKNQLKAQKSIIEERIQKIILPSERYLTNKKSINKMKIFLIWTILLIFGLNHIKQDWLDNQKKYEYEVTYINLNEIVSFSQAITHKFSFEELKNALNYISQDVKKQLNSHIKLYKQGFQNFELQKLKKLFVKINPNSKFIIDLHQYLSKCPVKDKKCKTIKKMIQVFKLENISLNLINKLSKIKKQIISFKVLQKQYQRKIFYENLNNKLNIVNHIHELKQYIHHTIEYKNATFTIVQNHFNTIVNHCLQILTIQNIQENQMDSFNLYYNNLISFNTQIKFDQFKHYEIQKNLIDSLLTQKLIKYEKICESEKTDILTVAQILIKLKLISRKIIKYKTFVEKLIDQSLKNFIINRKQNGGHDLKQLSQFLKRDIKGIGDIIIEEHSALQSQYITLWNSKIEAFNISYILKYINGSNINTQQLKQLYQEIYLQYISLVMENLQKHKNQNYTWNDILQNLVSIAKSISKNSQLSINQIKSKLISYIFAFWTLKNQQQNNKNTQLINQNQLIKPHPGQLISIIRMLSIKPNNNTVDYLQNNLIQIKTGQGKSITLAVSAIILALIGNDVSCVCYSKYLSQRDYKAFQSIFNAFGVISNIHYGTFMEISQQEINEQGDLRERVKNIMSNNNIKNSIQKISYLPKILLIDEVDVFFNKQIYGNTYNPIFLLNSEFDLELIKYIWKIRNTNPKIYQIQKSSQYQNCIKQYKQFQFLIKNEVVQMLQDLQNYTHDYIVQNDEIAYKYFDTLMDWFYGYKTMFAYFYQNQMKKITDQSLNRKIGIIISCGSFSYASIPLKFKYIMGVTGTLKTISSYQQRIIREFYKINTFTYIPSMFGQNIRTFNKDLDIYIQNKSQDYKRKLRQNIVYHLKQNKAAVLIFFKQEKQLQSTYNQFKLFIQNKKDTGIDKNSLFTLSQIATQGERNQIIFEATRQGRITFLTRNFGRGVDFICRDKIVLQNGGVHVISTFFSQQFSQQIQIMGRAARQGQNGSFSMVLKREDLKKFVQDQQYILSESMSKNKLYEILHKQRINKFEKKYQKSSIEKANEHHQRSLKLLEYLNKKDINSVINFYKGIYG